MPPSRPRNPSRTLAPSLQLVGFSVAAVLVGLIAFRACHSGHGFGNVPQNAWMASFMTGMALFAFLIATLGDTPLCIHITVVGTICALATAIHLIAF